MKKRTPKSLLIELFIWARCPKCGYTFSLNENTCHITDRQGLPPNIPCASSVPVTAETQLPIVGLNHHQSSCHRADHKQDIQPPDRLKAKKKLNGLHSDNLGKE
jgi:hypothetical protein